MSDRFSVDSSDCVYADTPLVLSGQMFGQNPNVIRTPTGGLRPKRTLKRRASHNRKRHKRRKD